MARSLRPLAALLAALSLGSMVVPTRAWADETGGDTRVDELKKRGNQAMLDLNYADALEAYKAAIAIAPDDATLFYNLGRAHQAREDYPAALDALERFRAKAPPDVRARVPKLEQLVADVRSRVGSLTIQCTTDVPSATVSIGGKMTVKGCGTSPAQARVSVPAHRSAMDVSLVAEGYQGQTVRVLVEGGGPVVPVTLTALPKSTSGTLLVRVTPADARISIDGVERGSSPLDVPVGVGGHIIDVSADRYDPRHLEVMVEAGRTRDVAVELNRKAPLVSKWWFWTGVGVVATGLAITVWYLVAQPESDPSTGTIPPGQVTAPLLRF